MPTTHLLYLHGFRSSPLSTKARQVAAHVARFHPGVTWWCPQLPPSPRAALDQVLQGTSAWPRDSMAVIGSSLGGFYATCVAQATGCRAVVLNPAVHPARDLARQVGDHPAWHDPSQHFFFAPSYVDELAAMEPGPLRQPQQMMAVIAKGDQVLDWREMVARYPGSKVLLLEGGDHALSGFEAQLPGVLEFLQLSR